MDDLNYECPKCKGIEYEIGEIRTTGGTLSKVFDVQNKHFTSVTCARCRYTEFYQVKSSVLGNIFDLFTN